MIRLGEQIVVIDNLSPVSDPKTAAAVMEFYEMLITGKAVVRVDRQAPPLAIERERDEN